MAVFFGIFVIVAFILNPIAFYETYKVLVRGGCKFKLFDPLMENFRNLSRMAKNNPDKLLQKEARFALKLNVIVMAGAVFMFIFVVAFILSDN